MRFHDAINGLFFFLLGLAVLIISSGFPQMPGQQIGPASFPKVIGIGMMIGGAIILGLSFRRKLFTSLVAVDPGWFSPEHLACVLFCLLGSLFLAWQFELIGFPVGAVVLCIGIYALSGLTKPGLFLATVAFVAVVALVMTKLLYVPLPMGAWL